MSFKEMVQEGNARQEVSSLFDISPYDNIDEAIEVFVQKLNDYAKEYYNKHYKRLDPPLIKVDGGKKFKKIVRVDNQTSVLCFVMYKDGDPKFKQGDILKAASWRAPALNFARGNVFDKNPKLEVHGY